MIFIKENKPADLNNRLRLKGLVHEAVACRKEIMIRISLKLQFSVLVSLLLIGVILHVSMYTLSHEKQSLIEERLLRGKSAVRNLATASAEAILSDN